MNDSVCITGNRCLLWSVSKSQDARSLVPKSCITRYKTPVEETAIWLRDECSGFEFNFDGQPYLFEPEYTKEELQTNGERARTYNLLHFLLFSLLFVLDLQENVHCTDTIH